MKNRFIQLLIPSILLFGIVACGNLSEGDRSGELAGPFNDVKELVHQTKKHIVEISPEDMKTIMDQTGDFYLIDIREKDEFDEGSIPGTVFIPRGLLEFKIGKDTFWSDMGSVMPSKDYKIIVYCKTGGRSALGAYCLQKLGYTDVASLHGGYKGWLINYPDEVYPKIESKLIIEVEETVEPVQDPITEKKEIEIIEVEKEEEEGGC